MSVKHFICCLILICSLKITGAQNKYFTKSGKIEFTAIQHTNANANSRSAAVTFDTKTGEFQFSVLVKSFEFQRAFMQEKFNNNVLETDQFPKASFKGNIDDISSVNFQKDGDYPVQVKGVLTLHGVSKDITTKGTLTIADGVINAKSIFTISIDDYNISNPGIGEGTISINVECNLEPMKG